MRTFLTLAVLALIVATLLTPMYRADDSASDDIDNDAAAPPTPDATLAADSGTDAGTVEREEGSIKLDGMSVEETKQLREGMENYNFEAEVSRMMKLIINSLYKNKEIFLRELISNASDALDKIRFLSLTDPSALGDTTDLKILIHADKENRVLHITDTGIGMTKEDLVKNLGTIAKSGTSEFLSKASDNQADTSNLIGQFGVGFYSAFLVADTVVVTSKHNDDKQHIWESDAESFKVTEDPREDEQLGRGSRISLYLKEEAADFLETKTLRDLIKKYSEFINFDIYLYTSTTTQVEEEEEAADDDDTEEGDDDTEEGEEDEDDASVEDEDEEEEDAPKVKKMVDKTTWDWEIINANKPIWTRSQKDVEEEEYTKFFQAFSKEEDKTPLGHIHFVAEGEVTFRSILFIPNEAPEKFYSEYGKTKSNIKMYVRRVFITDEFDDMMPNYLKFITGVVDSDDLPLNVSRETLQQHKLLKVIKKKLIRKALEMIKKLSPEDYKLFWKEFSTSMKLGIIEDYSNRTRLAKLLRFHTSGSADELTSLEDYVERMKKEQTTIYFCAGQSREEVESSPFVERLLKKGYEVLYLIEPVDEYTIQNLPEFDGHKFQNVAKEGLKFGNESEAGKKKFEETEEKFKPLTTWLGDNLKDVIDKAVISNRLTDSPCALIASSYGWSGNMERIMTAQAYSKTDDSSATFYKGQKKTLEINPRHPLIKELLTRVETEGESSDDDEEKKVDKTTVDLAHVLIDTARLRSGYVLDDSPGFASRIEKMLRLSLDVPLDAEVEEEEEEEAADDDDADNNDDEDDEEEEEEEEEEEAEETSEEEPAAHEEL